MQWLKILLRKPEIAGSNPALLTKFQRNLSSPLIREDSIMYGASVTKRQRAHPQTARAQILNPVSGEQCRQTGGVV